MSNSHSWRQLCLYILLSGVYIFALADSVEIGQLPFCRPSLSEDPQSLIFVSTLDGKISALDAGNHGEKQWTIDFNDGPMLSSNIHRRELNNNGQWVRLIPSLNGGLYKFDGENLETVPVTTDQLLHSSFRYSDDLVFSGGKETTSYGVSSKTGEILYECSIIGCTNNTDGENYIEQDVLVVQRFQQTVRAIEPRTGIERWNFSVGQHDLTLIPHTNSDCHGKIIKRIPDIEIKVIIPEGLIWAVSKNNPSVKLWQYKFDTPIVTIWDKDGSTTSDVHKGLREVNLFDSSQWVWGSDFRTSPNIYVGMYDRQLYVQENIEYYKGLQSSPKYVQQSRFPWQPYPAAGTAVINSFVSTTQVSDKEVLSLEADEDQSTTALSVLYNSEYINGNGFYLYSKNQLQLGSIERCNSSVPNGVVIDELKETVINDVEDDGTPVQIIIVSLWYWWKEVLIISITTAILLNFMLTQRLLNATTSTKDAIFPPLIVERHIETTKNDPSVTNGTENQSNFKSRYLTDFEPVDCLGKGGYGVVFEAKNKIDDCNYAIKRIALPNSQDSRERVMREVRALAKLDHHNIVRYFNAWLECPPIGWQEEHDKQWINKQKMLPSEFPSESTQNDTNFNSSVCIDVSQTDPSSVDSACEAYELNHIDKDEDSFIIFDTSGNTEKDNRELVDISDSSTRTTELSDISHNSVEETSAEIERVSYSESVVFDKNLSNSCNDKEKVKIRKSSFSLNLNSKHVSRKSAKMFLYIQMQLCQRLSLRDWLKEQPERDSHRILNIFHQIVNAVEYVHLQGLIHRDLKPSNIFFAYDNTIKIGDFGLVTAMTESYDKGHTPAEESESVTLETSLHTACVGTHMYMPPEQMNGQIYNYKVDIYSLGIILFELLIPFSTEMERIVALTNLRKSIFPKNFDANYPAECELLQMMMDVKPEKRPTTLGIKARPPLLNYETANGFDTDMNSRWHFELPQLTRHPSATNSSSSGETWENIS